jgi:general secretion pathway protein G
MKTKFDRRRAGFSLAELMVVIVIIALLATVVVQNALPYLFKSQRTVAAADITAITTALDTYAINNGGKLPDTLDVLVTPDENGNTYLKDQTSVPLDPWKNQYVYEPPRSGSSSFRVISYGKDGQPGGEGDDADIDNLTIRERK